MAERKSIPKKIRFEVLKRDSFTCQYCGASAPDVILEVDHIYPVAEGGTNDLMNLITSCRDCNRGKSKTLLSDTTVVSKQKKQADDIQKRREQLEMMMEWRKSLLEELDNEVDLIEDVLSENFDKAKLTDYGRKLVKKAIKEFGFVCVMDAIDIAIDKYDDGEAVLNKLGGICYNRKIGRTSEYYRGKR